MLAKCKCTLFLKKNLNNSLLCSSEPKLQECYDKIYEKYDFKQIIENICPLECESISVTISKVYTLDFPSKTYFEQELLKNEKIKSKTCFLTKSELKTQMIAVNVFYEDLKYQKITQQLKLILKYLNNVF